LVLLSSIQQAADMAYTFSLSKREAITSLKKFG